MRVGLDLVDVARLRRVVQKHPGFAVRTFTASELAAAEDFSEQRRYEFLAGRFAAKEAVLKALGVGLSGGIPFTEIEISAGSAGEPVVRVEGQALQTVRDGGFTRFETSISHDAGLAAAVVMLI